MVDLKKLAGRLRALDNEVKLKIITLLAEKGAYSITDISKELKLNFSTTHKYLEQLEKAGFLKSDTVLKNRLKRLFYVKDFDISVSPKSLVIDEEKSRPKKKGIKIITRSGKIRIFDVNELLDRYLSIGIPLVTIEEGAKILQEKAYDGITTLELEEIFEEFLKHKITALSNSLNSLTKLSPDKRTYADILRLLHPEALEMHKSGDIFIENLGVPKLFNFVHDIYGIYLHGLIGKRPKTLQDLFKQLEFALSKIAKFTSNKQAINSFNYSVVPLVSNLSEIKEFIVNLNHLGIQFYINLDIGRPRYLKDNFNISEAEIKKYDKVAEQIAQEVILIIANNKLQNLHLVLKFWEKKISKEVNLLNTFFAVNMMNDWQTINACYVGDAARYDMSWKRGRESKIGELQTVYLNLPRLALKAKNKRDFFNLLKNLFNHCESCLFNMLETTTSEFFRKHTTVFKSVQRERWSYADVFDSRYSIALFGLTEAILLLKISEKNYIAFAEELLNFCNKLISNFKLPARIELKVRPDMHLSNRLYFLDKHKFNSVGIGDYYIGAKAKGIERCLHKYLPAGHCRFLKRENLSKFLESKNCGQVKII